MFSKKYFLILVFFIFAFFNFAIKANAAFPFLCSIECNNTAGSWCIEDGRQYHCLSRPDPSTNLTHIYNDADGDYYCRMDQPFSTSDCPIGCNCTGYPWDDSVITWCDNNCIRINYCGTPPSPSPTPSNEPTPPPNPTPTPSPTPTPTPFCNAIKLYRVNGALDNVASWNRIDNDPIQMSTIRAGDLIYLVVRGANASDFNKARFYINGLTFDSQDTTPMQPTREFYYPYTIPTSGHFDVGAEVKALGQWW